MSFTQKRFVGPVTLINSAIPASDLYQVPAQKTAIIKQLVISNTTASAATFRVFINGGRIFSDTQVTANDTLIINLSQVMNAGDTFAAVANATNALNLTVSGVENDGPLNPLSTYVADGAITTSKLSDASVTQSKLASNLSGVTVTTSALRSTAVPSPFEGQIIYETDTDKFLSYNGSSWLVPNSTTTNPCGLELVKTDTLTSGISKEIVDAFNSYYDNYRIIVSGLRTSSVTTIYFRIGTQSGTVYYYVGQYGTYGSTTMSTFTGQGDVRVDTSGVGLPANDSYIEIEVSSPAIAKNTAFVMRATDHRTNGGSNRASSGFVNDTSIYTSFSLLTVGSGTTFTSGDVRVYGYRK